MTPLRTVLLTVACLTGGVVFGWRWFATLPPAESDLLIVEGRVEAVGVAHRSTKYKQIDFPTVVLSGDPRQFCYMDWFPNPEVLTAVLKPGDVVRLAFDPERPKSYNSSEPYFWIWNLQKEGADVVSYAEVLPAAKKANLFALVASFLFTGIGFFGLIRLFGLFRAR
jgi:hypothetical protein